MDFTDEGEGKRQKKRTPCKILTLFICVTLYLYIHISFRHVMSYSSFCHYTIGVSLETRLAVSVVHATKIHTV